VTIRGATVNEISDHLAEANAAGSQVLAVDVSSLNRVLAYTPEDMTVTVEAGLTLAALQEQLRPHGQWLPLDPPEPERWRIGDLIASNASGPRRFGFGTVREHLIGITVVLADGRVIHSGGRVVKNVAGYDLCKLFVGALGTLGVIVEATFKLRPLPEAETFVQTCWNAWSEAEAHLEKIWESPLTPVVLDLHRLGALTRPAPEGLTLVLGLAGTREEVEWQLEEAGRLSVAEPSNLDHETAFWRDDGSGEKPARISVSPSRLLKAAGTLSPEVPWIARAGNGVLYHRGHSLPSPGALPVDLMLRVKHAFDPNHILPELPW
jgi:FAD/FMN-containing dehydrogenase